jgi:hypothetical protein
MNYKKQAERLEKFLEDEFTKKIPIVVLPNNDLVYKRFKIRKNKAGTWEFRHFSGDLIDKFNLKVTAVLAAKFYDISRFDKYNEIKNLDIGYHTNSVDSIRFRQRLDESKQIDKKELYASRYIVTNSRAQRYKEQISSIFRNNF